MKKKKKYIPPKCVDFSARSPLAAQEEECAPFGTTPTGEWASCYDGESPQGAEPECYYGSAPVST